MASSAVLGDQRTLLKSELFMDLFDHYAELLSGDDTNIEFRWRLRMLDIAMDRIAICERQYARSVEDNVVARK